MVSVQTLQLPHGNLESLAFPTKTQPSVYYLWNAVVHNDGGATGGIVIGIGVISGPGSITSKYGGTEQVIEPGYILWYGADGVPVCTKIYLDAEVKFNANGDYVIWIVGGHKENGDIVADTYAELNG